MANLKDSTESLSTAVWLNIKNLTPYINITLVSSQQYVDVLEPSFLSLVVLILVYEHCQDWSFCLSVFYPSYDEQSPKKIIMWYYWSILPLNRSRQLQWKRGLTRRVVSYEGDNLVAFYSLELQCKSGLTWGG